MHKQLFLILCFIGILAVGAYAQTAANSDLPVDANPPSFSAPFPGMAAQQAGLNPGRATWSDDFNRASGTNMGADWTEWTGDMAISSNHGMGNLSSGWSYMLHNSASMAHTDATMKIDLVAPSGSSGPHVALIMGATSGSTTWLYTKIQDNNDDGYYDRIFFYSSGNGGGWGTQYYQDLTTPVQTAQVTMYMSNGGDTLNVDIDNDFNGTVDQHHDNTGALALGITGTEFGIGAWAMGSYDNWEVDGGGTAYTLAVSPDPIVGGQNVTFTVTNGTATTMTYLVYSTTGTGSVNVPQLGITLGIANPQLGFNKNSDGSGTTVWSVTCPTGYAGPAWLQACQMGMASNVVATAVM